MLLAGSKPMCAAAPFPDTSLDKQVTMKDPCVTLQLINPLFFFLQKDQTNFVNGYTIEVDYGAVSTLASVVPVAEL